jgi:hypothetical protein
MQTITQMKNSARFAEHTYPSKLINLAMKVAAALNPKQPPCVLYAELEMQLHHHQLAFFCHGLMLRS